MGVLWCADSGGTGSRICNHSNVYIDCAAVSMAEADVAVLWQVASKQQLLRWGTLPLPGRSERQVVVLTIICRSAV